MVKLVLTGAQLRAARGLIGWSAEELAGRAGLTRNTVQRLERAGGVPRSRSDTLVALQRVFEEAGIEFVGTPDEGPGVRLWSK